MTVTLPSTIICNHPLPLSWRRAFPAHAACLCPELAGHTSPHTCGHGVTWGHATPPRKQR